MNKRGIAWGYMVAGALAIIVLVVMAMVFTDNMTKSTPIFSDCVNKGGECLLSNDCSEKEGLPLGKLSCVGEKICCIIEKDDLKK